MRAEDVVAALEKRLPTRQGHYRHHGPTGEPYVRLGLEDWSRSAEPPTVNGMVSQPGVLREFTRQRLYLTEAEGAAALLEAFALYEASIRAKVQPGADLTLYWRYDAPHVFWHGDESWRMIGGVRTPVGAMKCRLLLSAQPVVEMDDAAYDAGRTAQLERDLIYEGNTHGQ